MVNTENFPNQFPLKAPYIDYLAVYGRVSGGGKAEARI